MAAQNIQPEQKNVVINPAISTVFFQDQALAYNYKTQQWSELNDLSGKGFFSTHSADRVLGVVDYLDTDSLVIYFSSSTGSKPVGATFATGDFQLNPQGRAVVDWARPFGDMAGNATSNFPRIGVKDNLNSTVAWSNAATVNSRTGKYHYRAATIPAEGRYVSLELQYSTFTSISGVELEFYPQGKV